MQDIDPQETQEWLSALESVVKQDGPVRAKFIIDKLTQSAREAGVSVWQKNTPYCNTITVNNQPQMVGDAVIEQKIRGLVRWNAMAMVVKAQQVDSSLGGHIGTFSSSATLYDVGFTHFFKGPNHESGGDLLYIQGHASPGIYARSYLLGEISEDQLVHFRREVDKKGVSSYPHPWLMPNYWQFPTVSMGLGPIQAIYQARYIRYLENRNLIPASNRKVWCFCGDGEMDEPESVGALTLPVRENLDNLIFVINCNLQRLDGPVRGNGKIIQELEGLFAGAGWNVIKTIWGKGWDKLFAKDKSGLLQQRMEEALDGEYQNYKAKGGAFTREHFFGKYDELKDLVSDLTDEDIFRLKRGGHDFDKVYSAYHAAVNHKGQPTVILAKTVKGYGLGKAGEALNTAHNTKKLNLEEIKEFRNRFNIAIPDAQLESIPFYKPDDNSPEIQYLKKMREKLGGNLPARRAKASHPKYILPDLSLFKALLASSEDRELSTTMAFVRILTALAKDKNIGKYIVPIVPDEARTFGMEGLFRQLGIYSSTGQKYEPVDSEQVMFYKEATDGQILQEGLNEAGAFCSWLAAATSYSTHNLTMIPFYIYYSMFGFQRVGDLAWAAGDSRARGFLIGATSGRTTLNGEGLQHQDGHSHVLAGTIPNCVSYDPTFAYELAVIIQNGLKRMVELEESVYFYITVMNENYTHPAIPEDPKAQDGIIKGLYLFNQSTFKAKNPKLHVQLMGSGTILREVIAAQALLEQDFGVTADVWSATSINELRKDGLECERYNQFHPDKPQRMPYVAACLNQTTGPVIISTDYMKLYAEGIRQFINKPYYVLGTDGFGRSDTRERLREFFEVDRHYVVYQALKALVDQGGLDKAILGKAQQKYNLKLDAPNPLGI
jgi:pyruvate dehydrogenase E1 component